MSLAFGKQKSNEHVLAESGFVAGGNAGIMSVGIHGFSKGRRRETWEGFYAVCDDVLKGKISRKEKTRSKMRLNL